MQKPRLYLLVGYPGAGKTTVARLICKRQPTVHLWADQERHAMFEQPTHSAAESKQLYNYLNQKTRQLLSDGKSVIFDTNFNFRKDRQHLRRIAGEVGAETVIIWVTTPKEVARQRAVEQSHGKDTRIWGNMPQEDFQRIASHLQPPTEDENVIKIDGTNLDEDEVIRQLGL